MEDGDLPPLHGGDGDLPLLLPGVQQPGGVHHPAVDPAPGQRGGDPDPGGVLHRLAHQKDALHTAEPAVPGAVLPGAERTGLEGGVVPRPGAGGVGDVHGKLFCHLPGNDHRF